MGLDGGSGLRGHNTDFSGDQFGDVLATRPDGSLWAYLGNGAGGWRGQPLVGGGWQIADAMFFAGDFAGNGHPAMLYRMSLRRVAVDVHDGRRRRLEQQSAGGHRVEHLLDGRSRRGTSPATVIRT